MTVVLDDDIGVFLFDSCNDLSEHNRTTDTRHVFEADLLCAAFDKLLSEVDVILGSVYFRIGDTHRCLCGHTCLFRPFDGRDDVTRIVQTAEDTGDVGSLCVLHFVHQLTHIRRHRIHAQGVQTAVQHMGLDTRFVERLAECTHRLIRVLTVQQVHLLGRTAVRFHTVKTAHVDDHRRHTRQLVFTRHITSATLPHVTIDKGELNFFFAHICILTFNFQLRFSSCTPLRLQRYKKKFIYTSLHVIFIDFYGFFCNYLHISKKSSNFAGKLVK